MKGVPAAARASESHLRLVEAVQRTAREVLRRITADADAKRDEVAGGTEVPVTVVHSGAPFRGREPRK